MEEKENPIVAGLVAHVRDLQQRAVDAMRVVNSMRISEGKPPMYLDKELTVGSTAVVLTIKRDQFYGEKVFSAMRQYLVRRKLADLGPAKLDEIYSALCQGGLRFETENEDNRKTNMRFLLRKNTHTFHRLPDDYFALTEWYPDIAKKQSENGPEGAKSKPRRRKKTVPKKSVASAKPNDGAEVTGKPQTDKSALGGSVTQEKAVRNAIDAMKGNFKKQDVVDWIVESYPDLHAAEKRQSIFAMLGKLKDQIELAEPGKAGGPSTYRRKEK